MKKLTKRTLALMLALVMAIPTIFVLPSTASAAESSIFHWTFDSGSNMQDPGSGYQFVNGQIWGSTSQNSDNYLISDGWILSRAPGAISNSANNKNWRIDFEFEMNSDSYGANRVEHILGISNSTDWSSSYGGGASFGVSTNGRIYINTLDVNTFIGDTGVRFKKHNYEKFKMSYIYYNGTVIVMMNDAVKFRKNMSSYSSLFENVQLLHISGSNGRGTFVTCHDLEGYSIGAEDVPAESVGEHLRAQYFTNSDLTKNSAADGYYLNTNGSGFKWDEIACKWPDSKAYYYCDLNSMLANTDMNQGFSIAFTGKRGGSSWQRYFEFTTGSAWSGGSVNYLYFSPKDSGYVKIKNKDGYGDSETGSPGSMKDDGGWHSWMITVKEGQFTVYCDGTSCGTVSDSNRVATSWFNYIKNNGKLLVGASSYDDPAFTGYIRDFRVYDTYINSDQIANMPSATTTLNPSNRSCVSNNSGRWSNGRVNIVNDGKKGSTSAGLYKFDINSFPSAGYVDWASATFTVQSASNENMSHHQIDFYCVNYENVKNYINGGHYSVDWGEGTTGTTNYRNNLGLNASTYIGTMQHTGMKDGATVTVSLTEPLIKARNNGWSSIVLVAVQRNISNDGSPWSDTWLYDPIVMASVCEVSSDGSYQDLTEAITNYEAKMASAPYTNMKAAYDAYVLANRYADAMYYGNATPTTAQVQNVTNALLAATENMKPWTYRTGDMTRSGDYTVNKSDLVTNVNTGSSGGIKVNGYSDKMDNVVYAMGVGDQANNGDTWYKSKNAWTKISMALEYGPIVFLYDGVTTPAMPISLKSYYSNWDGDWRSIYINGTADLQLGACWHGRRDNSRGYSTAYDRTYHTDNNNANSPDDGKSTYYYSTTLYYTGGNSSGFSNYVREYSSIAWGGHSEEWNNLTGSNNTHIYIVDYKSLRDKIAAKLPTIRKVADYKEGGMADLLTKMDNALELDPNHYIMYYSSEQNTQSAQEISGASTLGSAIGTNVSALNGATATADADTYDNLKAEMRSAHASSPTGNSAKTDYDAGFESLNATYTKTSVNNFRSEYELSVWHFGCLIDWPYSHGEVPASGRLTRLQNTHHGLEARASFTALDAAKDSAINELNSLASANTTSSVAAARTYLTNAAQFPYEYSADRTDTGVSKNSEIATEATKFSNWKTAHPLEAKADFSALDLAKNTWTAYLNSAAITSAYTTSSRTALSNYINSATEFPLENTADRNDTGTSQNTAISNEVDKYTAIVTNNKSTHPETYLDPVADLTYFDAEYDKANTFLNSQVGKAAEYTEASVQAVVNAVTAAANAEGANKSVQTIANANAEARADYGQAVQEDANDFADDIKNALDGLVKVAAVAPVGVDTSAFVAAVNKINNFDPDAYENSASISSAYAGVNAVLGTDAEDNEIQVDYKGAKINVLKDGSSITQQDIEDATNAILDALTVSTKKYVITTEGETGDVTCNSGSLDAENKAPYGTTIKCDSGNDETAWYLEIRTGSMHKELAFQGYGRRFQTKVLGTTKIKAVKKTESQKKVKIVRKYGDNPITDKSPVQFVDYVAAGGTFELPAAPAIAFYEFDKYYIGETGYAAGASVTISEDTEIIARYTVKSGADCAINVQSDNTQNQTVAYNTKVSLTGANDTYGWVEAIDATHYRPFKIGKDVEFFASESTELKAVTKSEFDGYKFTFPCVNLRKGGIIESDGKKVFNAQLVNDGKEIQEYGILIAAPLTKAGSTPIAIENLLPSMVIIENSGKHEGENAYQILRAKSTKLVGANQFTISVSSLPSEYIYRGYAIYKDANGNLQTVYSEAM